jgi:hypothetical protein
MVAPGTGTDRVMQRVITRFRCEFGVTEDPATEFILGIWNPLSTTLIPASVSTASNRPGYLPSRSRSSGTHGP